MLAKKQRRSIVVKYWLSNLSFHEKLPSIKIRLLIFYSLFFFNSFAQIKYLDSLFSDDGISLTNLGNFEGAWSVFSTNENKIIVSGWSKLSTESPEDILLMRFNNDGSIDSTFKSGNIISVEEFTWESSYASIEQKDGKILIAGRFYNGLNWDFMLARFYADGRLDSSFAQNGFAIIDISSDDRAFSIDLQNDDKIIIAGFVNINNWDFAVLRFNSNGLLDNTFGNNGIVINDFDGDIDVAFSIKTQSDSKIIACGWTFSNASWNFAMIRYNSDGSLDQNFGNKGIVITDVDNVYNTSHSIAIQEDGKYVVTGYRYFRERLDTDILLVRYNSDGSIDQSFGVNGFVTKDINRNEDFAWDVIIQSDERILVTGYTKSDSSKNVVTLRFNNNGQIDSTFGDSGVIITSIFGFDEEGRHLALQNDGKILVTGYSFNGVDQDLFILRINPDGNILPVPQVDSTLTNLSQNYPNPFTTKTLIPLNLHETSYVTLKVYNALGEEVSSLIDEVKIAGNYKVLFDRSNLSSGIYLYQLITKNYSQAKKMLIIK
ncbi:MAG TPA: T9SS type A sorting domain-containing protein [Ignavibacteriaceae bacterium]|nr:T9SS type A sorting domain-containing protein [Ignavibacteriaceae bacterium]